MFEKKFRSKGLQSFCSRHYVIHINRIILPVLWQNKLIEKILQEERQLKYFVKTYTYMGNELMIL